jgi:phosphoglycolate phosphatase
MMGKYKLLIFDWDGTLCDSVSRIAHCMQEAARLNDLRVPTFGEAADIIGLGLKEATSRLFPDADEEMISKITTSYSDCYRSKNDGPSDFFPFVLDVLSDLKSSGYQLAVATGKSRAGLNRALKASSIDTLFHDSRCADETASKPDPLMLAELLDVFGLPANQALMVGDTEYDMDMAERINMPRLAVSYGAHHADRLAQFKPIACIDCFYKIKKYI